MKQRTRRYYSQADASGHGGGQSACARLSAVVGKLRHLSRGNGIGLTNWRLLAEVALMRLNSTGGNRHQGSHNVALRRSE